ncbi:MAG: CPBP family intramembrane glutamic endopeptidase [Chitinophagales bacterium]
MIGIIVQLAISWLIVWLFEKGNLGVLGFRPSKRRLFDFALFFIVTAICCSSGFFMRMYFGNERWEVNPVLTISLIGSGLWWHIKSVLFEELIFRGVLLYILIKRLGATKAIIISAVAFGIYHWFSHEVIGNVTQMAITFVTTGTIGLLFAYGYAKTFSLYIPCAIHLGWNFTQGFIFPDGPIGNGILIKATPETFRTDSYILFYTVSFLPIITTILINYILLKRRKQVELLTEKPY